MGGVWRGRAVSTVEIGEGEKKGGYHLMMIVRTGELELTPMTTFTEGKGLVGHLPRAG